MKNLILGLVLCGLALIPNLATASDDRLQDANIMALERMVGNYAGLQKQIDGLKGLRSDVARLLEFERIVTRKLGDIYTKSEMDALLKKAREDLTNACRDLNDLLNKRIDDLQNQINEIKAKNEEQDGRLAGHDTKLADLDKKIDQREVFVRTSLVGGLTLEDDTYLHLIAGAGISKRLAAGTFDLEALVGGTQEDDGFLTGLYTDFLFGDNVRGGPGLGVVINFGNNTAELVPTGTLEVGSREVAFTIQLGLPFVVADPESDGGLDGFRVNGGLVLRF